MTGIICLTLKYTVNTLLMNSEGSVRMACARIFMPRFLTSEENNCRIQEGWPFMVLKSTSVWLWIIEYRIIKMTLFGGSSGKSKMPWLYPGNMNLNYFWICMNYMNISLETLPGCNHINSSNCQRAIWASLSLSSTPRTVQCLALEGEGSLPLNPLFFSHLDSLRKLLFPRLGDTFSALLWMMGRKGTVLC